MIERHTTIQGGFFKALANQLLRTILPTKLNIPKKKKKNLNYRIQRAKILKNLPGIVKAKDLLEECQGSSPRMSSSVLMLMDKSSSLLPSPKKSQSSSMVEKSPHGQNSDPSFAINMIKEKKLSHRTSFSQVHKHKLQLEANS